MKNIKEHLQDFIRAFKFSQSEVEILELMVNQIVNPIELSSRLHISHNTVTNQLKSMYKKAKVSGKAELLAKLIRQIMDAQMNDMFSALIEIKDHHSFLSSRISRQALPIPGNKR